MYEDKQAEANSCQALVVICVIIGCIIIVIGPACIDYSLDSKNKVDSQDWHATLCHINSYKVQETSSGYYYVQWNVTFDFNDQHLNSRIDSEMYKGYPASIVDRYPVESVSDCYYETNSLEIRWGKPDLSWNKPPLIIGSVLLGFLAVAVLAIVVALVWSCISTYLKSKLQSQSVKIETNDSKIVNIKPIR